MLEQLGRFHLVVLHLPIGLLLGLCAVELAQALRPQRDGARIALVLLVLVAATAALSCVLGLALAADGSYHGAAFTRHRFAGIAFAVLCVGLVPLRVAAARGRRAASRIYPPGLGLAAVLLVVVGHLGGTLTHGEGFLWQRRSASGPMDAPPAQLEEPIAAPTTEAVMGDGADAAMEGFFEARVAPLLSARCVECHGARKHKGGLRLDGIAAIRAGGDGGPVVVAGHPERSPLYLRTALDPDHEDIMPARGDALSAEEQEVLRVWIAAGATAPGDAPQVADEASASDPFLPPHDLDALGATLPDLPADALDALRSAGLFVRTLDAAGRVLEVAPDRTAAAWSQAQCAAVRPLAAHVAWLDANRCRTAALRELLPSLRNLRRATFAGSDADDAVVAALSGLRELESLNLVATRAGDAALRSLEGHRALRSVHLWRSGATAAGATRLARLLPSCRIMLETR